MLQRVPSLHLALNGQPATAQFRLSSANTVTTTLGLKACTLVRAADVGCAATATAVMRLASEEGVGALIKHATTLVPMQLKP